MGVTAAHLHHLVMAPGRDEREDLGGDHPAELGVAEPEEREPGELDVEPEMFRDLRDRAEP